MYLSQWSICEYNVTCVTLMLQNISNTEENGNIEHGEVHETTLGNGVNGGVHFSPDIPPPAPAEPQTEEERLREAYKNMPFDEKDNDEWILVALVLDSFLAWIFLVLLILTSSLVLVIVPSAQSLRHT